MPTQDSGKPPSRKRTSHADTGAESSGRTRGARRRETTSGERPTPAPEPAPPSAAAGPTSSSTPAPAASDSAASGARAAGRRTARPPATPVVPLEPAARALRGGRSSRGAAEPSAAPEVVEPVAEPLASEPIVAAEQANAPQAAIAEPPPAEEADEDADIEAAEGEPGAPLGEELHDEDSPRRRGGRGAGTNALGVFIERQFANPNSPCHSYSDLERHSNISREALSRYVTARADRRRSPTIDTLVAIADALHVGLEAVARAAGASVRGVIPPPEHVQHAREEALGALVAALSDQQFSAVVELLRQMRPPAG